MIEKVFDRIAHSAAPTSDLPAWILVIPQVPSPWATWYGHRRLCQKSVRAAMRFIRHIAPIVDASNRMTHFISGSKASCFIPPSLLPRRGSVKAHNRQLILRSPLIHFLCFSNQSSLQIVSLYKRFEPDTITGDSWLEVPTWAWYSIVALEYHRYVDVR